MTRRLRRPEQDRPVRQRLRELAGARVSYGYPRLHVLLRREGWVVNRKRVYRLYREEGLTLKRRRPTRRKSAVQREGRPTVTAANERWAMDFMHDTLSGGRSIRVLTLVDVYTRECLALEAAPTFRGEDVVRVLAAVGLQRTLAAVIQVDNGTEFTSKALDHWAYWNHVQLDFSRPGKPTDNAVIESFNATVRRECLSQHWWVSAAEAQHTLAAYRHEYNNERPHSSLGHLSPRHWGQGGDFTAIPRRPPSCRV
jgi:putative transposase